ncbi:hypothetical protein VHA_001116 [Grimontia hollisae CIP 101886]|uniref:Uncharacterized protein n=1 Tax=Grimontia hollisae CIP 101886 TaxID=675812 RepID=D0I5U9_GRIHO|nr:hypothetical protein VHA_001116 [Grimontia hollisae CIP 101886]
MYHVIFVTQPFHIPRRNGKRSVCGYCVKKKEHKDNNT